MDFNIRALCMARAIQPNASVSLRELVGTRIEFKSGHCIRVQIGSIDDQVFSEPGAEQILASLHEWARVYRYSVNGGHAFHVLALDESGEDEPQIFRVDMWQPPVKSRRSPPEPVTIKAAVAMTISATVAWLCKLARNWAPTGSGTLVLQQPKLPRPRQPRIVVVGAPVLAGWSLSNEVFAIGRVLGAEIIFVKATDFRETRFRVFGHTALQGAILICAESPHISEGVLPASMDEAVIFQCEATEPDRIAQEVATAVELVIEHLDTCRQTPPDEDALLLKLMLRSMRAHSKVGKFLHCPRETVLRVIRARRLNVPKAEELLTENSEKFSQTKEGQSYFLWKAHHDGDQYFLNPKLIQAIDALIRTEDR